MGSTEALPPIGPLMAADAAVAVPLSTEAGWNQVEADWRFMLEAGTGFAAREHDGLPCGSALVLPLDRRVAWISMVLVTARRRRLGLGTALLERCLDLCAARGVLAGLDATELGRPVYRPLGFQDVFALRRWRVVRAVAGIAPPPHVRIAPLVPEDLAMLETFDAAHCGVRRGGVLRHLVGRGAAIAARDAAGAMLGYALSRDGRTATQIGPVIASDPQVAAALLCAICAVVPPPYVVDVPEARQPFAALLEAHGGASPRGFMRMTRGEPGALAAIEGLHAIAGPELG
jgi:GNAT superfamily N-acetyltransferase